MVKESREEKVGGRQSCRNSGGNHRQGQVDVTQGAGGSF